VRKGDGFRQWALAEMPDVLVLNEHKLDESLVMPHGAAPAEVADGPAAGGKAKKPMARQASLDGMLGKTAAAGRGEDAAAGSGGPAPATASASAPASTKPKGRKPAKAAERFNAASLFGGGVFAHETWACTTSKKGYAGVVAFSRTAPLASSTGLGDPELDSEGRVVTLEWPGLAVVGCYTPNSGMKLDRLAFRTERWDPAFRAHLLALERRRGRVLVVGDLNAALRDFDVYDPKRMRDKQAGFCDAERASLAALLAPRGVMYAPATQEAADGDDAAAAGDAPPPASAPAAAMTGITQSAPGCGFVDTWLAASEANAACSQWSFFSMRFGMRPKNKGWRLDYGLASEALAARVVRRIERGGRANCACREPARAGSPAPPRRPCDCARCRRLTRTSAGPWLAATTCPSGSSSSAPSSTRHREPEAPRA